MSQEPPSSLVEALVSDQRPYGPEKIILFGSAARGEADEYSDLDIVVIKRTQTPLIPRWVEAAQYIKLPLAVDVFVYTPEEFQQMVEEGNPFIEQVLREGRVIYEKP